jgi:hypothetical protein
LSRSKNVSGVTHPQTGIYCIKLDAGIDASQTGLVATPNFYEDDTGFSQLSLPRQTIVEWHSSGCGGTALEVDTGYQTTSTAGSPDGDVHALLNVRADEGFFFVVP